MAVTNNAVQISAGLVCTLLTDPPIGASGSGYVGYDPDHAAIDTYVNVAVASTPLHTPITLAADEYGLMRISNPNAVAVTILSGATQIGIIPPGSAAAPTCVLIPVGSTIQINATVASSTATVGVTIIHTSKNTA